MKARSWRLTRRAEATLVGIAKWTLHTFGPRQAVAYQEDLIDGCARIAAGTAATQACRAAIDPRLPEALRLARVGQHLVIFVATDESVTIIDFLHPKTDLPGRLATSLAADKDDEA